MLELVIDSIRVSLMNYQRVIILRVKDSDKYLPIWIGPSEADAIALKLQDVSVPRPLTHDLLRSVINTLGAPVDHIVVSDLSNDTFFAKIGVQMDMETGKPIIEEDETGGQRPLREEELKSLSAFQDFIGTLDLEDLGQSDKT